MKSKKFFLADSVEGAYDGAFVTSFEVGDRDRAVKVVEWGRRRWNGCVGFIL